MKVDASILMGDRGEIHPIRSENKSFLELNGLPLFFHVLQSLEASPKVSRIFIVGDQGRLKKTIEHHIRCLQSPEKIILLEQGRNLFENAMIAFEKALELEKKSIGIMDSPREEKAVLYLPGDIPLITSQEIDEFLGKCDLQRFDFFVGISTDESLKPFYPTKSNKGIKMAYFYVKDKKFRHNNMYLAKPLKIRNLHYIQKMYDYRYQKEFVNFLRLLWTFSRANVQWRGFSYYIILHWNLFIARLGLEFLTPLFRQLISLEGIEKTTGSVLGCKLKIVETKLIGAAIDIDNEKDYETISIMFNRWREYQKSLIHYPSVASHIGGQTAS